MKKVLSVIVGLLALAGSDAFASDQEISNWMVAPTKTVKAVYKDKTWFWKDGAGYFRKGGRFLAISGSGSKSAYVIGGWAAYRNGKVCFSGTWRTAAGSSFDSTCFLHREKSGALAQKREPVGQWYVFKHNPVRKDDEIRKIVPGDYASPKVDLAKRAIEAATK